MAVAAPKKPMGKPVMPFKKGAPPMPFKKGGKVKGC